MEAIKMANILAERLRQLREREGLTQKRAAEVFGITNFQLSRYENGQSNPDPDLIKDFAKYYEVTTDYLLGLSDSFSIDIKNNDLSEEDLKMLAVLRDPKNELFFKEMASSEEEKLEQLRKIWAVIKDDLK